MEEQPHLEDREGRLQLGQLQHQPRGQTDAAPLGLPAHRGGLQQEREEIQEIINSIISIPVKSILLYSNIVLMHNVVK